MEKKLKLFNKNGLDINAIKENKYQKQNIISNKLESYETFTSSIFLPKCSVNLIEHEILYILEEVTHLSNKYDLIKLNGNVFIEAGTNILLGTNTSFTSLKVSMDIVIKNKKYTIISITDDTHLQINEQVSHDIQSDNFYLCDYKSYSTPLKSLDTLNETYNIYFKNNNNLFFLYNIIYEDKSPIIQKINNDKISLLEDLSITIDDNTDRYIVNNPIIDPFQINIGFSSSEEGSFENTLIIENEKQYKLDFIDTPVYSIESITFTLSNNINTDIIYSDSIFYIKETNFNNEDTYIKLSPISLNVSYDIYNNPIYSIKFEYSDNIPKITNSTLSNYNLILSNKYNLCEIYFYEEVEGEDERLKILLNNFNIDIDENIENIFRESDINEDLPDYTLLNEKRKEMLLSYDQIYPYIGSYKSLFNILNYLGYNDIKIKEYFINIDIETNEKKYLQIPTIRNKEEKELIKKIYDLIPSKTWKKTPFLGLYFDINKETGNYDERDLPIVEDSFQFSIDEILIKLFNLKEYLKHYFLPLNSRIIDITGEGVYYEKIKMISWSGNTNFLELNIGNPPDFNIYPETPKIIAANLLDKYYINEYKKQGYSGFIESPFDKISYDNTTILKNIKKNNIYKLSKDFNIFSDKFNENVNYLPPAITDPNFNDKYKYFNLELADKNEIIGSPILLEMNFTLNIEDCNFTYEDLENLNSDYVNTKYLTFTDIGRSQYTECRWVINHKSTPYFYYDSGRKSISDYEIEIQGDPFPSIPCEIIVSGMSGNSISSISIKNPGYGYKNPPSITVPGTFGQPAEITATIENGYVNSVSIINGGDGYPIIFDQFGNQEFPVPIVSYPDVLYETITKELHTILLPYDGDYDIFLYLYDVTNNFTMQHKTCHVKKDNATFLCSYIKNNNLNENSDYNRISISDIYGTWADPLLSNNINIDNCDISFDTLSYDKWINHDISLTQIHHNIIEINRDLKYIVLDDIININENYLYFKNEINSLSYKNILINENTIGDYLQILISGTSGDNKFISNSDVSSILNVNEEILYDKKWYKIIEINQNKIFIDNLLETSLSNINCIRYKHNNDILIHNNNLNLKSYSKLLITDQPNYVNINSSNYYTYVDFIKNVGQNIKIHEKDYILKELILKNSSDNNGTNLYLNAQILAGDYAIKIKQITYENNNTKIYFDDINNELYNIDSNFNIYISNYDVDYAKNKINFNKYQYETLKDITIEDIGNESFNNLDYNPDVHCGFLITKVCPSGSIKIDEYDTFYFSGSNELIQNENNEYSALSYAMNELIESTNNGISSFTYSLLPKYKDTKYLKNINNENITITEDHSSYIVINDLPDPKLLKIPAVIETSLSGDSLIFNISNPGYGYDDNQAINIIIPNSDDPNGTCATLSISVQNSQIVIDNQSGGNGYNTAHNITIDTPYNYEELDNIIWTGKEWHIAKSIDILSNIIYFETDSTYDITINNNILMPFNFHKQLIDKDIFNQFYYFIYASSNTYDINGLSYIYFNNGVEGEWSEHPSKTYSYPFLNYFNPKYKNDYNYLYEKWQYEGGDMPITDNFKLKDFKYDKVSTQNRMIFNNTISSFINFENLIISEKQQTINKYTYVLFSIDNCKMVGKSSVTWQLIYDNTNEIIYESSDKSFVWFFSKEGTYTIKLNIIDLNGNSSHDIKQSFINVQK